MCSIRYIVLCSLAGFALSLAVAGCEVERPSTIPSSAQMMGSGNRIINFTAPSDGMTYIFDKSGQRLVWSGRVTKGQSIDVDPQRNQITVGGSVMADRILNATSQHVIFFDPSPMPVVLVPAQVQPSNNSVIVTPNATVQQTSGQVPAGSVTVQPGLSVSPAAQPTQPTPQP